MTLENIYKYGYGLLKLDQDTLYNMDLFEFMERVEGSLLWHEQVYDTMLNWMAWYTANIMMSSGNMKKGTDALKLKKNLYKSIEDIKEEEAKKDKEKAKKSVEKEREELIKRFNIDTSQLNIKN